MSQRRRMKQNADDQKESNAEKDAEIS